MTAGSYSYIGPQGIVHGTTVISKTVKRALVRTIRQATPTTSLRKTIIKEFCIYMERIWGAKRLLALLTARQRQHDLLAF